MSVVNIIIPAYNEELSIAQVIAAIPAGLADDIIVIDNNSKDRTAAVARAGGATVLEELYPGYGSACLRGIAYATAKTGPSRPDILVFLDGDLSDYPEQMPRLLHPILHEQMDLVIGSRALGQREPGAMLPQQLFGNWLASSLLRLLYRARFTDLGPFRAIRTEALMRLDMQDRTYGWTVEMQLKAAKLGLRYCEVPVDYRRRIGFSKISGTVKGTVLAGYKIISTLLRYA